MREVPPDGLWDIYFVTDIKGNHETCLSTSVIFSVTKVYKFFLNFALLFLFPIIAITLFYLTNEFNFN